MTAGGTKRILCYGCFFSLSVVALLLGNLVGKNEPARSVPDNKELSYELSRPRQEVRRLTYDCLYKGNRAFTIYADRVWVRKKKLGFISFGLLEEIAIENADIVVFEKVVREIEEEKTGEPGAAAATPVSNRYGAMLLSVLFPVTGTANIVAFTIAPVRLEFNGERAGKAVISARKAAYQPGEKGLIFSGGVRVVSGEKELVADKLMLQPEKQQLTVREYTLKKGTEVRKGAKLTADIFLGGVTR